MVEETDAVACLCLVSNWLPLTQVLNEEWGWHLQASSLEHIILAAAPLLSETGSLADARLVLYYVAIGLHGETL